MLGPTELVVWEGWDKRKQDKMQESQQETRHGHTLRLEEGIFLEAWAVFKEGGGGPQALKGLKRKRSFWTTEMMCLWKRTTDGN